MALIEAYCVGCGRKLPISSFWGHKNEFHTNKAHIYCKDCCKEISQKIMIKYCKQNSNPDMFSYSLAIRHICSFFDLPYFQDVTEVLYDVEYNTGKDRDWNYVYQYQSKMKEMGYDDKKYWNNLSGNSNLAIDCIKEKDTRPTSEGDLALFRDLEKKWGKHIKSLDEFIFLEELYETYTADESLTAPMINMIKYLCHAELDVMLLKQNKADQKEISNAEKRVADYYAKLHLDNFKFSNTKSDLEKMLENDAYLFEKKEPIEEGVDVIDLSDRLGIDKDYDNMVRSFANKVVGTKDYPSIREEDIKKGAKKK